MYSAILDIFGAMLDVTKPSRIHLERSNASLPPLSRPDPGEEASGGAPLPGGEQNNRFHTLMKPFTPRGLAGFFLQRPLMGAHAAAPRSWNVAA
eukprot:1775613-Pyramimonas_sp.AAC.1